MKIIPSIYEYTAPGTYHITRGLPNQDAVLSAENTRFRVIALADGVGSCAKGGQGASIACRSIINQLLAGGQYYMELSGEKTARYIIDQIRHELKKQADGSNASLADYSSTAMFLLLDKDTNRMLCLNLGDGLIMGVDDEGCVALSKPGLYDNGCCVTTTEGADRLTSVLLLDVEKYHSVTLFSDGAWHLMYDRCRMYEDAKELVRSGNFPELAEYLTQKNGFDDFSYIGVHLKPSAERRLS